MPAYKEANGTWCARFYTSDYYGNRTQKKKRGFKTKREALEYEREFPHFLFPCHSRACMSFIWKI